MNDDRYRVVREEQRVDDLTFGVTSSHGEIPRNEIVAEAVAEIINKLHRESGREYREATTLDGRTILVPINAVCVPCGEVAED